MIKYSVYLSKVGIFHLNPPSFHQTHSEFSSQLDLTGSLNEIQIIRKGSSMNFVFSIIKIYNQQNSWKIRKNDVIPSRPHVFYCKKQQDGIEGAELSLKTLLISMET